ncbi:hypothetical protein TSTA_041980 [Talaromyces stipitatus ATCC 10500]|uniref:Uncharacterized protein n=1 Tax=Talaromyces stipitatus (strain ATCC 10500 / CBS 375.48 / QM 6759 / NRRL 1006) TaxID=441959 RepID=B8MJD4_TALSN|nr:uncharacterized protein TSTA_041980 [Talaromyces stipitatus ATCC 10500]EED14723.1 hypothetical protein TSTA_041980 [Talaromyces stipitatus ATCC 10500]
MPLSRQYDHNSMTEDEESQSDSDASSVVSEVFSDDECDDDSSSDSELESEDSEVESDFEEEDNQDPGQLSQEDYLAIAKQYCQHVTINLVQQWYLISDSEETVRFLYAYFSWQCDICHGKNGRHNPGIKVKSSLETF